MLDSRVEPLIFRSDFNNRIRLINEKIADNEYSLAASFLDSLIAVLDTINESINETTISHYLWRGEVQNQDDAPEKGCTGCIGKDPKTNSTFANGNERQLPKKNG